MKKRQNGLTLLNKWTNWLTDDWALSGTALSQISFFLYKYCFNILYGPTQIAFIFVQIIVIKELKIITDDYWRHIFTNCSKSFKSVSSGCVLFCEKKRKICLSLGRNRFRVSKMFHLDSGSGSTLCISFISYLEHFITVKSKVKGVFPEFW